MAEPLHGEHGCQLRQLEVELAAHQLPDPTIVTLCFCSWAPRDAIVLESTCDSCFDGDTERREAERLERRRRAVPVAVAMMAVGRSQL